MTYPQPNNLGKDYSYLYPYQDEGAHFLDNNDRAMLADEPGLGKTLQAIAAADMRRHMDVLVICPAVAKVNWKREIQRWSTIDRDIEICTSASRPSDDSEEKVYIVNYDLISKKKSKLAQSLGECCWDVVILDEGHYLKTPGSNRTQKIYGKDCADVLSIIWGAESVWLLTGTPAPNHSGELYTHLSRLFPGTIQIKNNSVGTRTMTQFEYEDEYCKVENGIYGRQIKGSRNMKVLRKKMAPHMLRRHKKDVLKDLPPLFFTEYQVDPTQTPGYCKNMASRITQDEIQMRRHMFTRDPNNNPGESDEFIAKWFAQLPLDTITRMMRGAGVHQATQRRFTGMIKAPLVADLVRCDLQGNHLKQIVFAYHTDVIDKLIAGLADFNPVRLDGKMGSTARQNSIDWFQSNPANRVFVGQIQACGTAITLTAASTVTFAEASWVPSENHQAACRAHRIGQQSIVNARFISLAGSTDSIIQRALAQKASDISELFD